MKNYVKYDKIVYESIQAEKTGEMGFTKEKRCKMEFVKPELCRKCGTCCKMCGCHLSPKKDILGEVTEENLRKLLRTGRYTLDLISKEYPGVEDDTWIIRIRNKNEESIVQRNARPGTCILLTENGCRLSYEERPEGGKKLIPVENGGCYSIYTIGDCCEEWIHYQETLEMLAKEFENLKIPIP